MTAGAVAERGSRPRAVTGLAFRHDLRLVPAALTVWLGAMAGLLVAWWLAIACAAAALVAGVAMVRRPGARSVYGAAGALIAAGALLAGPAAWVLHDAEHDPLREYVERGGEAIARVTLTDRARPVRTAGFANQPGSGRTVLARGSVDAVRVGEAVVASSGRVLLVAPAATWSRLLPGQQVTARGSLTPAHSGELIVAVLQIRAPPEAVTEPPWWQRAAQSMRESLREACAAVLGPEEAGLLPGLVVGDTTGVPHRVEEEFLDAGMSHLVAVSGANVAVVCGAVLLLLRLLRVGPRTSAAAAGLVLMGFVILVGYEPSVLRASVMGGVGLLALFLGRSRSAMPALAFAVAVLVLVDPAMAVSFGFALSVVATGALVLLAPVWAAAMRRRGVPPGIAEGLAIPLAAFVVTAPIIAGMAGEVSLVTVAANVLAAPVVALATVLGFVAAVTAGVAPWLAQVCVALAGPEAGWLVLVAREAAAIPGAVISWPGGWWGGLLAAVLCGVVVVLFRYRRFRSLIAALTVAVMVVLVPVTVLGPGWPPSGWTLVACDVGQGDGFAIATGDPGRAVVVDTGTELGDIDRCLDRLDVDRVPLLVLSHLHADHIGGLDAVLGGRSVGAIAVGPGRSPEWAWDEVSEIAHRRGVRLVSLTAGQGLRWPRLDLRVIGPRYVAPAAEDSGTDVNNASLVIMATTPAGRVLFTGDVELAAQADLLASGEDLRADVLKVPHHGSRYTLPGFVAAVEPRIALISVGAANRYGHPSKATVDALRTAGATVVRTDKNGDTAIVAGHGEQLIVPHAARGPPKLSQLLLIRDIYCYLEGV